MGQFFLVVSLTAFQVFSSFIFFGDLGVAAGIWHFYHRKLFPLIISDAVFSRALKSFEDH